MKQRTWLWALVGAWIVSGCGGPDEPVARLEVRSPQLELSYPGMAELGLEWRFDRPLEGLVGEPRVFVHMKDELGALVRTFDHPLPGGWRPGATQSDPVKIYQSALAPPLTAGTYRLTAGLYDADGNRWPLQTEGEEVASLEYRLATVSVSESADDFPIFFFSPEWLPVEGGTDRQVLGRRWLGRSGFLRVSDLTRSGTLWLGLGIPSGAGKAEDLIMEEGAETPTVVVSSDCGEFSATVVGSGAHWLPIPLDQDPGGELPEQCEVTFDANYYLISLETLARRTVALENLSWGE